MSIDAMKFLRLLAVGGEVICYFRLERARDTSLAVHIETWAHERGGKHAQKVTEGVFAYVAVDEKGRPQKL